MRRAFADHSGLGDFPEQGALRPWRGHAFGRLYVSRASYYFGGAFSRQN
jgi:hypothetical protein